MTLKLYEIEFVEELEFENKRLTLQRDRATAKVLQIDGEYVDLQAKVEQLEGAIDLVMDYDSNLIDALQDES